MRLRAVAALMTLIASATAAQPAPSAPAPAADLVAAAKARAKLDGKVVMVEFTAQWCGWCHRYERFLSDTVDGVGRITRDNFVVVPLVVLDSPERNNPGSDVLMKGFTKGANTGIPFYAFLDATGAVIGTSNAMPDGSNIGHPAIEAELEAYDRLLGKVAPRITSAERLRIRNYLRAMK